MAVSPLVVAQPEAAPELPGARGAVLQTMGAIGRAMPVV